MTRQNLCPNPAAKNNTTGYAGGATFARTTDFPTPACPRSTGVRATGSGFIQTPTAACAPGDVFTASFYGHNGTASDFDFGHTVYIAYTRSAGGDTFPQTHPLALGAVGSTGRFSFTADPAPANATGIYLLWDSLITGYGLTGVLLEKVGAFDTYADGDTSGWAWDGTNGNSTSSEAPTTAEGTVDVGLGLAVAATGSAAHQGATDTGLALAVAAAGSAAHGGVVALTLDLAVAAAGARSSAGAAALGLGLDIVSAGARASLGASALGLRLAVSAAGRNGEAGRPVSSFPWTPRPVSGFPWETRPVRSFEEVTE